MHKSLLVHLTEVIALHWPGRDGVVRWLGRALMPNLGTVLVVIALLYANNVIASPGMRPSLASSSTTTISYQGRLADSSGNPITTSGVAMQFRLYDVDTGGAPLWEETQAAVPVEDGLFHVLLGSTNPIPVSLLASNSTLWLGITVGSDSEMTPREQIASVPYAMVAERLSSGRIETWKSGPVNVGSEAGAVSEIVRWTFQRSFANPPVVVTGVSESAYCYYCSPRMVALTNEYAEFMLERHVYQASPTGDGVGSIWAIAVGN